MPFVRGLALLALFLFALPGAGAQETATTASPAAPQEVSIGIGFNGVFGVGDTVRPGDWAGLLLVINDSHDQPRNLAVRVSMPDPDGDTIERQRVIASTPGRDQSVWMYVRLPFSFSNSSLLTVSVHEVVGESAGARTQIGRTLSWTRIQPRQVVQPEDTMIGVVGRAQLALSEYELADGRSSSNSNINPRTSNDTIHIVSGIQPASMPDQWLGLLPFESVIWTDPPPRELGESPNDPRPSALRNWVQGGGHLVIMLPVVGDTWFTQTNPVFDLLPDVTPRRVESVSYEAYRQLLTDRLPDERAMPLNQVINVFESNAGASPEDAIPIINGPDGTIVVRKLIGTGMVTLIGLDLSDRRLMSTDFAPDAFWHRILAKRFDILTSDEKKDLKNSFISGSTQNIYTDAYIEPGIRMSATAAAGVLLGLVVFALYWILAGPGGFGLLKLKGLQRHSWLAFVAMVAVFAAISWLGSRAARPTSRQARHVTYLDHVYGQDVQRARVWATIMLPTYEDQRVALTPPDTLPDHPMALTPFAGPARTQLLSQFPDARAYVMDVRHPEEVVVPARSTSKTFQFDWIGVARARGWGMPTPDTDNPPRFEGNQLVGSLRHALPAPLTNIRIVVVQKQLEARWLDAARREKAISPMPFVASAYAIAGNAGWAPGDTLNLADVLTGGARSATGNSVQFNLVGGVDSPSRVDSQSSAFHFSASFYSMLNQPDFRDNSFNSTHKRYHRRLTQALDLSKWFTQPCLIVIGEIDDQPSPVPIYAGSPSSARELPTTGRTVVRWVYPLTPNPPVFSEINQ
ncbi:MAG: hypothetical protein H6812_04135 [Phycisphaeraceae bacterium]|nr:hypothetical protein [Phycisphaerales bacterium]MCB9842426.1 hypothetical protein [Phycisphaeraceae bacterium]